MCFWRQQLRASYSARDAQVTPSCPPLPAAATRGSPDGTGVWGPEVAPCPTSSTFPPTSLPLLGSALWSGGDGGTQIPSWGLRKLQERGEGAEEGPGLEVGNHLSPQFGHQLSGGLWDTLSSFLDLSFLDMKTHVDEGGAFEPVQGLLAWAPSWASGWFVDLWKL